VYRRPVKLRIASLTAAGLVCFAANSILARLALRSGEIDAASFTAIRLASGAAMLLFLVRLMARPASDARRAGSWLSAAALFVYAVPFSYAYLRLDAAVGALVLFGAVQLTMIGWGLARGERPGALVWIGLALALGGLTALASPGATAPDPLGLLGMAIAGAAWGVYSLRGRVRDGDPVRANAASFARSVPMAAALVAVAAAFGLSASPVGVLLAVASGAIASAVGYVLWYAALEGLTATRAAVLQLLVPIETAAAGVLLLGEPLTVRLALAGAIVLAGVGLAVYASPRTSGSPPTNEGEQERWTQTRTRTRTTSGPGARPA
jgi:drug/metabolite transporter (DMT)-like permease